MIVSSIQQEDGSFKFTFRKQNPISSSINELIQKNEEDKAINKLDYYKIKNIPVTSTMKPFTFLESLFSKPGEKCNDGKICTGGSLCMAPNMLCLCPGTLIEKDGECINPTNGVPAVEKVNVGGLCTSYSECLDGSSCILGRCRCILPLIENNGKCILQMVRKEVGPGEVCENGEICTKGSICDSTIPVCICPAGTDLNDNEECVPVVVTESTTIPSTKKYVPLIIQTTPKLETTQKIIIQTTKKSSEYYTQPTPRITTTPSTTTTTSKTIINTIYTQPTIGYTKLSKPLSIGTKFLKVGEICSLNTDCMIGAYCNGNSNPPSCQCLSTHVNVNGKCEKVIYPGQYGCKSDIQCSTSYPGASCHDRQCVCPLNYRAVEQTCVSATDRLISPPGGSCGDDETCTGGSICKNDWCVCPEINMIVVNGLCLTSDILASTKVFEVPTTIQTPQKQNTFKYNQIIPQYNLKPSPVNSQPSMPQDLPSYVETIQNKIDQKPIQEVKLGGRKVAPGMNCGPLDTCVGGSSCFDNYCVCPTDMVVDTSSGRCMSEKENEESSAESKTGTLFSSINTYKNNNIPIDMLSNKNNNNIDKNNLSKNNFNINNSINNKVKSLLTENIIPLPSSQLYIIRRPSSSYNSLTTSFLSSIPGMDIRDMMPKIIKHNTTTTINDKDMLSNQNTNTNNTFNNINNNVNTIPSFTNIFSKIISNNNNSYFSPETIKENNMVMSNEINEKSYIGDSMNSYPNTNTNKNNNQPSTVTYSSSYDDECAVNGLICRGGAICVDGSCQCPKDYILLNDKCLPPTGRRYSQRRGKENFLFEDNTSLPNESCANGEMCLGGSICQDEKVFNMTKLFLTNKICQCPTDKSEIIDGICVSSDIKEKYYGPGEECSIEKKCTSNAECYQGICRCLNGYIAISNDCIQLPTAQSKSITNNVPNSEDSMKTSNSGYGSTGRIDNSEGEKPKPRFVAPSIRRPKNNSRKTKSGGVDTITGAGTCPPGNSPTRDESTNRVISCNGMTPNCPPRSYCYVTGPADGNYNCCKSF